MRLWHYKLIPFLPNSQLIAQWRELNSIYKKQDNHILINYVYEYPKEDLLAYSYMVISELEKRGFKINSVKNFESYFDGCKLLPIIADPNYQPFANHHTERYLKQCFYNLQEKYDRGQKDFSEEQYVAIIIQFCKNTKCSQNLQGDSENEIH